MFYDEEFLKSLPDDWHYAIEEIAKKFTQARNSYDLSNKKYYYIVEETQRLLQVFCEKYKLGRRHIPAPTGSRKTYVENIHTFINNSLGDAKQEIQKQDDEQRLNHYKNVFEIALSSVFHFEFTEGDLDRIQQLINELRDLISKNKIIKQKHKQRLLSKLENVQKEFHKTMTTLDLSLGAIIETGVALGRFGEDVKPLTDRIGELAGIILSSQKRAYGLPSSLTFKLLGQSEDDKSKDDKSKDDKS